MRFNGFNRLDCFPLIWVAACLIAIGWPSSSFSQETDPGKLEFFERHIRPRLVEHCYECHSAATETSGGLALDSRESLLKGGDSGSSIHVNDPDRSLLMQAIEYRDPKLQMPPSGKLSDAQIESLRTWIAEGAVDPRDSIPESVDNTPSKLLSVDRALEPWAYRPLKRVVPPFTPHATHPIDAFLAIQQNAQTIKPSPLASLHVVKRRLDADLSGLSMHRLASHAHGHAQRGAQDT